MPPQPREKGWSGREDCHWVCWSEWEKSWGGLGVAAELKLARVTVVPTRVPTLAMKARSLLSNMVFKG